MTFLCCDGWALWQPSGQWKKIELLKVKLEPVGTDVLSACLQNNSREGSLYSRLHQLLFSSCMNGILRHPGFHGSDFLSDNQASGMAGFRFAQLEVVHLV